jgi:transcription initiation factor TFIID subunit 5
MSDSPQPTAGPSNEGNSGRQQGALIRQFVEAYLQQHGFDKALETYRQGFEDAAYTGGDQNPEGEEESTGRTRAVALGDAVFRAPGPVGLDSAIKRNIPQASFASASTMSEHITPEFEAQAKYIIDAITKKAEGSAGEGRTAERGELLLDPSDRIEGYKRYRRWVDDGLDLWKVSREHRIQLMFSPSWMQFHSPCSPIPSST